MQKWFSWCLQLPQSESKKSWMESLNQFPEIKALYANLRNWVISPGDNLRSLVSAEVTLAIKLVMASEVLSWGLPMSFMVAPSMIWEMKSNFISFIGNACNVRSCEAFFVASRLENHKWLGRESGAFWERIQRKQRTSSTQQPAKTIQCL